MKRIILPLLVAMVAAFAPSEARCQSPRFPAPVPRLPIQRPDLRLPLRPPSSAMLRQGANLQLRPVPPVLGNKMLAASTLSLSFPCDPIVCPAAGISDHWDEISLRLRMAAEFERELSFFWSAGGEAQALRALGAARPDLHESHALYFHITAIDSVPSIVGNGLLGSAPNESPYFTFGEPTGNRSGVALGYKPGFTEFKVPYTLEHRPITSSLIEVPKGSMTYAVPSSDLAGIFATGFTPSIITPAWLNPDYPGIEAVWRRVAEVHNHVGQAVSEGIINPYIRTPLNFEINTSDITLPCPARKLSLDFPPPGLR